MRAVTLDRSCPYPEPCSMNQNNQGQSKPSNTRAKTKRFQNETNPSHNSKQENSEPSPQNLHRSKSSKQKQPKMRAPEESKQKSDPIFVSETKPSKERMRSFRADIENLANEYLKNLEILPIPLEKLDLACNLTEQESTNAKHEMHRLNQIDQPSGFDRRNEYFLEDVDRILNIMKRIGDLSADNQSKDIMLCQAFNNLINIRLKYPYESIEFFTSKINEMFPNGLLKNNTDILVIGLYSSTGMKRRLKNGILKYDSYRNRTQGHFITAKLDLSASRVTFIDSLNEDISRSSYFDFPIIAKILTDVYSSIKMAKNEEPERLQFSQQMMKRQMASDCGLHLCSNAELLIRNLCPGKQYFRDNTIKTIRQYHYLICNGKINSLRLDLIP